MKIINQADFNMSDLIKSTVRIVFKSTYKFFFIGGTLLITGICLFFASISLESNLKFFAILFSLFGIVFLLMPLIAILITKQSVTKQNKLFLDGVVYKYEFEEEFFTVEITSGENVSTNKLQYNKLFKIQIDEEDIILYTSASSMYIVKKAGFESDFDCEELIEFLSKIDLRR